MTEPIPPGFRIELDTGSRWLDGHTLYGGAPPRVFTLTELGARTCRQLLAAPLAGRTERRLARRLTDAGLAHPQPPPVSSAAATVVIPTRDRSVELDRCLSALGRSHPVVVVDDGSDDPAAVAEVVARHGAQLVRRSRNGGPGPARNTGLATVDTDLVAFLDTDCVAPPDWIRSLAAHLQDPLVVGAAPRIVPLCQRTTAERYAGVRGSLDLGSHPARVARLSRVPYVPTAAIVFRRSALSDEPFEESLRYGEDVDLVWRLIKAGGRIRYEPSVQVRHAEPSSWARLLERRFRYGTSAAALAQRHPENSASLILAPGPAATVAAILAGRPFMAGGAFSWAVFGTARALHRAGVRPDGVLGASVGAVRQTWLNVGDYAAQFALPIALVAARGRRRWPMLGLLVSPGWQSWIGSDRRLNAVSMVVGQLADNLAYGAGVWWGCLRHRTLRPLRPLLLGKPVRRACI